MKKVLVTGGAGFIGSHICDAFQAKGNKVIALDNLSTGAKENLASDIELLELDIRSSAAKEFVISFKPDLVIHAAAQISVSDSMKDPCLDADINIVGLANILNGLKSANNNSNFVFISTGGAIYGEQSVYPAPESHVINPTSFYGLAKRVGELYLDLWQKSYGLKYSVLRLANVYGPRQNPHGEAGVVAIFNKLLLSGKVPTIFGDGLQTRDYIYVGDVVNAVVAVCEKPILGTFNIGTGIETNVNELYRGILNGLNMDIAANYAEPRAGEQKRSCIDAALAKAQFNWSCTVDLSKGLELTSTWFKQQN